MNIRRLFAGSALTLAIAGVLSGPAFGLEANGSMKVDDGHLHQKKEFGAIAGNNPVYDPPGGDVGPSLSDCQSLPGTAAVKIDFAIKRDVPTKAQVKVSWPAAEANDVDIYFFNKEGELISDSASADPIESFELGGLPNGEYWLCVNNYTGVNTGFTIEITAKFLSLYERPPEPPTPKPHNNPTTTKPPVTPTPAPPTLAPVPTPSPEVITTPGPNGSVKPQQLYSVSGSRQAAEPDSGRSGLQIGLFALTGVIVATGVGLVVVRIRRDTGGV